jgi:hypothetical protein
MKKKAGSQFRTVFAHIVLILYVPVLLLRIDN